MSFGFAIEDFFALRRLAWKLYKDCKGASAEFREIVDEIISLHVVVREIQEEAEKPNSLIDCARFDGKTQLHNTVYDSIEVPKELEYLLCRFQSLGTTQKGTRIERKLDELTAQVRAGQHEQSTVSVCDEGVEQDKAWRLLASESSANFTKDEIEAHREEIKSCIRDLMERGDLEESSPQPERSSCSLCASKSPDPSAKIEYSVASLANLANLAG